MDSQCRLAISGELKDTSGSVKSTANMKGDTVPLFLLVYCPTYELKSRLKTAR